jgi:hypothetical protein
MGNESPTEEKKIAIFNKYVKPKLTQMSLSTYLKQGNKNSLELALTSARFTPIQRHVARGWFEDLAKGHMETIHKDTLLFDDKKVVGLPVEALMYQSVDRIQGNTNFNKQEAVYAKEHAYVATYQDVVKLHASGKNRKRFAQISERVNSGREIYPQMRKDLKRIVQNAQKRIGENKK